MFNSISLKRINSKCFKSFHRSLDGKQVWKSVECYVQVFRINRGFSTNLFRINKTTIDKKCSAKSEIVVKSYIQSKISQGFAKDYLIRKSHLPLFLCLEPKQPELTWRYAEASAFPRTESIFTFYKN